MTKIPLWVIIIASVTAFALILTLTLISLFKKDNGNDIDGVSDVNTDIDNSNTTVSSKWSEGLEFSLAEDEKSYVLTGIGTCEDTDIVIPETHDKLPVTKIDNWAFLGLPINSIAISKNISSIEESSFLASPITSFKVDPKNEYYSSIDGNLYTKDGKTFIQYAIGKKDTVFAIPNSVTSISDGAFAYSNIICLTVGNSVTSIDEEAFYYCQRMVEVYNRSSLNITAGSEEHGYVAYYALNVYTDTVGQKKTFETTDGFTFYDDNDASYLLLYNGDKTEIALPNSCNGKNYEIYFGAFNSNSKITSVTIPAAVTAIGDYVFSGCSSLKSIFVSNENPNYKDIDGNLYTKDEKTLIQYAIGKENSDFSIPDSVNVIAEYAFNNCTNLTKLSIGSGVTTIALTSFSECTELKEIHISSIESWCDISYGEYNSMFIHYGETPLYYAKNLYLNGTLITDLVIPDTVTAINDFAFKHCLGLTSVTIPDSVTSIGGAAFADCTNLNSITFGNNVATVGEDAFKNCTALNGIYVDNLEKWFDISFAYNSSFASTPNSSNPLKYAENLYLNGNLVTELVIPENVTKINAFAFNGCTSITKVIIHDNITYIGRDAFADCTNLTTAILGNGITANSINHQAFSKCDNLATVYYSGDENEWSIIINAFGADSLKNAAVYFYSENTPTAEGNFWYYENGEIKIWNT